MHAYMSLPSVKPLWKHPQSCLEVCVLVTPNPVKLKSVLASGSSDGGHTADMRICKHSQVLNSPKSELVLIPEIFENGSLLLRTGQHSETESGELPQTEEEDS